MPSDRDQPIVMREFAGTNIAQDPAFIGTQYLQSSQNWIPSLTGVLTKRNGTASSGITIPTCTRPDLLFAAASTDAVQVHYLLVVYRDSGTSKDTIRVWNVTTGTPTTITVTNGVFTTASQNYGAVQYGNTVYVANGTDPIKSIPLSTSPLVATDIVPIPSTNNDSTQTASLVADAGSNMLTGTYSYRWVVYNSVTKTYTQIYPTRTFLADTPANRIHFTAPTGGGGSYALGANETWHLFVSPPSQPVEFAFDQTPQGLAASAAFDLRQIVTDTVPVPIPNAVTATGNILVQHKGRIFIAGSLVNPIQVQATDVLIPGLEQTIFNQGTFFPAGATLTVDAPITGLATVSMMDTNQNPQDALAIFTKKSTWLFLGDFTDPAATLMQLSSHIGCISQRTIQQTPIGTIWCGTESVYKLQGEATPQDIGWPIWPVIRAVPQNRRGFACGVYQRGFYKLYFAPAGGGGNTVGWWLDLRTAYVGAQPPTPPWWGPHTTPAAGYVCFAQAETNPVEDDRAWGALESTAGTVLLQDEPGSFVENGIGYAAVAKTSRLDDGQPFLRKLFTRTRCIAQITGTTSLQVAITADATQSITGTMPLPGGSAAQWNVAQWNVAQWGSTALVEGALTSDADRELASGAFDVTYTHIDNVQITLRDFEFVYIPIGRPVAPNPPLQTGP